MGNVIKLTCVSDGWFRVEHDELTDYVAEVEIAGVSLAHDHATSDLELRCEEYGIVKGHYPALLVEAPSWYSQKDD